ncbi:MAG: dephospho-CoA kinase [Xanthomonadales bacterium]|nr:dephospho-CoA kinase [Desulfofustis sp.]NNL04403.1 dephospho-CoA kinase [Xanthomonadales bacterium]
MTVALTGGIASGKSVVSDIFQKLGVAVIDTDRIAREIVKPGKPALRQITAEFGRDFLLADGSLNRSKMREAIFSDNHLKKRLEAILHPLIADEVRDRVEHLSASYCILVIPLFVESTFYRWVDRVLVVDAPPEIQVERVMARDGIGKNQAIAVLQAQASRETRLSVADDVIENHGLVSDLSDQVKALDRKYLSLSAD